MQKLYNISSWVAAHITLMVLAVSAVALTVPASFEWISTKAITPMLGVVMFGMGLTLNEFLANIIVHGEITVILRGG